MKAEKILNFDQRFFEGNPVCSCCNQVVAAGAKRAGRDGHTLHDNCGSVFDVAAKMRADLDSAFQDMPEDFFEKTDLRKKVRTICTFDSMRSLLLAIAKQLYEKKEWLIEHAPLSFNEIVARLRTAAERIRLGRVIDAALAA